MTDHVLLAAGLALAAALLEYLSWYRAFSRRPVAVTGKTGKEPRRSRSGSAGIPAARSRRAPPALEAAFRSLPALAFALSGAALAWLSSKGALRVGSINTLFLLVILAIASIGASTFASRHERAERKRLEDD